MKLEWYEEKRREQCGEWLFSQRHLDRVLYSEQTSSGKKKFFHIIRSTCLFVWSGMSDRLAGIVGSYMTSILTKREFHYIERGDSNDLLSISWIVKNLPVANSMPIFDSQAVSAKEVGHHHYEAQYFDTQHPSKVNKALHVLLINEDRGLIPLIRNGSILLDDYIPPEYDTVIMKNQFCFTIKAFEVHAYQDILKETLLSPENAFGCIFDYIFQPKPEIFLPVYDHFKKFMEDESKENILKIGIHLRAGDVAFHDHSHVNPKLHDNLFQCAIEIQKWAMEKGDYTDSLWYVISDNPEFREYALQEYSEYNIYTTANTTIIHGFHQMIEDRHSPNVTEEDRLRTYRGAQQAAAEWWLFGLMDYHIAARTGYATAAAYRKPYRNNLFFGRNCFENNSVPMDVLGSYLPGI
jgi:hypothetical protein